MLALRSLANKALSPFGVTLLTLRPDDAVLETAARDIVARGLEARGLCDGPEGHWFKRRLGADMRGKGATGFVYTRSLADLPKLDLAANGRVYFECPADDAQLRRSGPYFLVHEWGYALAGVLEHGEHWHETKGRVWLLVLKPFFSGHHAVLA